MSDNKILALSVRIDLDGNYAKWYGRPVWINPDNRTGGRDQCQYGSTEWDFYGEDRWLRDLQVHGQASNGDSPRYFYARSLRYKCHTVELQQAEDMAKALKRLERAIEKMEQADGRPQSMAEFTFRAARAMKCKLLLFRSSERAADVSGYGYQACDVDGAGLERMRRLEAEYVNAGQQAVA